MKPVAPHRRLSPAPRRRAAAVALTLALGAATPLAAQSVLTRPPALGGTRTGVPGTIYFNFLHRFEASPAPVRKVVNYPTFLLAAGLPDHLLVGAHYATNSVLVPNYPNEWENFAKFSPLEQSRKAPLDLAVTAAYNQPARSWDGELALARDLGPLRVLASGRGFSSFRGTGDTRWALAGGATLRLNRFVALAGDVSTLLDRVDGEDVGWGAGLQIAIPYTPHTLSLQVSNTNTTTLEGASIGAAGRHHWGFEFTIPLTLSRWFGSSAAPQGAATASAAEDAAVEVTMSNQLRFSPAVVHVKVGQTVRWRNASDLIHTVTLDPSLATNKDWVKMPAGAKTFNSGNIKPGATFAHTFTVPGEYQYFCIPHAPAGMVGRVIVDQ
jgi:plastocyanin